AYVEVPGTGDHPSAHPLAVRVAPGAIQLYRFIAQEQPALDIDRDHSTWAEPALFDDLLGRQIDGAGFARHDDQTIARYRVARRAQPVAIQSCADKSAVAERKRRRAVPRFRKTSRIIVEGTQLLGAQASRLQTFTYSILLQAGRLRSQVVCFGYEHHQ